MKCMLLALFACLLSIDVVAVEKSKKPLITESVNFPGDAAAGKIKSEENRCQECHGADGNGQGQSNGSLGKFAKLAGQYPDYITKQLSEFKSGIRKHDLMKIMATSIDETDAIDIAAYFSGQHKMQGDGTGKSELAEKLFAQGDASRNIIPCASCHGINGKGVDIPRQKIPVIGGQEWRYFEKQLQDWRSGERHNSDAGIMNTITKQLTDDELIALANYISGL